MSTRHGGGRFLSTAPALFLVAAFSAPVPAAITVSFEQIAHTGDPVPGREALGVVFNGRAFQRFGPGVFSRPSINNAGQVVFMARSTAPGNFNQLSTIGIYLKSPGMPLKLIVDQSDNNPFNTASIGAPFAVPGRAADARFSGSGLSQLPPLINNRGDVLFVETFHSPTEGPGQGIYVVRAADGLMIKVVDTFDQVPGLPGQTFTGFFFSRNQTLPVSMNDQGQIVFLGRFRQVGAPFEDQGLYGVDIDGRPVAGGPIVRLADSTQTVFPATETAPFRGFSFSNQPAINNNGMVIFQAAIGNPPQHLDGIYTIPVDGSAGATTIARRGQASPVLSNGIQAGYFVFGGHDINDAGQFVFQHAFSGGFGPRPNALIAGDLATLGDPLSVVVDTLGGFSIPGQPAGTTFTGMTLAPINELGQMGFYARDDGPIPNAQGLYAADLAGSPFQFITHNESVPPGRVAPAKFIDFTGRSAAINDLGNMAIAPSGSDTATNLVALFGLYFFDGCTQTLERVVDDETSLTPLPDGLGDRFLTTSESGCIPSIFNPCERGIEIFDGPETRSGHFRSINNNDDIAFFTAFSTFNVGVFVAHVQTGGGGDLRIVCPQDVTVECPAIDTSPTATGDPRVCSDIPATVTSTDASSFGCGNTEQIIRTWTADDGNTQVSCDQIIDVVDTTPPDITGIPADAAVQCNAVPPPANPTAIDGCAAGTTLTLDEVQTPGACAGEFMLTRTWTATDACGNTAQRTQILTVGNTIAPILTVPPDVTIDCNADSSPAGTGAANATAGCAGMPAITFSDTVVSGSCGTDIVITRTWTATDDCGNTADAVQIISVSDATPPVLTAPADLTIECDADSSPTGTGTASASDGCPGTAVVNFTDAVTANDLCGAGSQITRTWTATDDCNNIASVDQILTVVDTTPPVLTIPADTTVSCSSDHTPAATGSATAMDGCDTMPALMFTDSLSATCPQVLTRTWTATDECGNSIGADQIITLIDTTAPVLTVPADVTIECDADSSPAATGQATATDDCDGPLTPTFTDVSTGTCPTIITRTWTATDTCGQTTTAVQTITVQDTTAPTLVLPVDVTIACDQTIDPSNTGQATATDNCDPAPGLTYTDAITPGLCAHAQTITRTWRASDACGNETTGVQTITVIDASLPSLSAPADVTIGCDASTNPSNTGQATAADNCDPAPVVTSSDVVTAGACPNESLIRRTWTATDACGNAVSIDQIITIVDTVAPALAVPAAATVACDADSSPAATGNATATDNCDAAPSVGFTDGVTPGVCPQEWTITRTWSATDACGNPSSADQTISVVDQNAPVITLNGAGTVVLAGCVGELYVELGATALDNCDIGPIAVTVGGDTVDTSAPATFVVTYDAVDACGNIAAQQSRIVNVVDSTAPAFTALPGDLTVECEGQAGVPATNVDIVLFLATAAATDACDPIVGITNDAPPTFPTGDTTVTWTATDNAGNALVASRIVHVVDTTAPDAVCPAGVTLIADANCQAALPDVTAAVVATDVCAGGASLTVSQDVMVGTPLGPGVHTITVTVADPAGNSTQCTTAVTVLDTTPPTVAVPLSATVECDQSTAPASTGGATASDNCDPAPVVTFADTTTPGVCPQLSVITRQWTATDASGNAGAANQTITVVDTAAPTLTCPADIATSGGFGGTVVTFGLSADDACDPAPSASSAPPSGSFFPTGVTPVTATGTDQCVNVSTPCSFDVLVSCFGVNRAKIGTKDVACRGIEKIEFTSMDGAEELISLFKAEEGSGGGVEEDTLPASIIVDDGVNGPVTVDTSCAFAIDIGDVFGPYTVTDIEKDHDDHPDNHGNEVELRGSFVPAVPFDLAVDDMTFTIDDGQAHTAAFTIPAGLFQIDGNPNKGKFKFEGDIAGASGVKVKLEGCEFKFKAKNATGTGALAGTTMTLSLAIGPNFATETITMEDKGNHLKFKRQTKINCCPECIGVASMQVTSDQGVLVFTPPAGQTKLASNTIVDDGVNGAVTIHTSCSQDIEVGDTFGAYTISELIKVFEEGG